MDKLLEFLSFQDPNVRTVTFGTIFLGMSASTVGTFAFLRKRSLVGDAVAHSILPGIAIAFMLFHTKNPFVLMGGALLSGWLAMLLIEHLSKATKLKPDTAIGLVLSVFFGIGILLLTSIQHSGAGNQAGLDQFLFGKAASMTRNDLIAYGIVALILLITVILFFKEFKLLSFNPDFAEASGLPVKRLQFILSTITVLAIAIGIQSVGVVLMAALLITPAATARPWTERLVVMMVLAGIAGGLSGLVGSYISFAAPNMPTGPWIVMCLSFLALFSLFLAPRRGVLARIRQQRQNRRKILSENLLKSFYHLREHNPETLAFSRGEILEKRAFSEVEYKTALRHLRRHFYLIPEGSNWRLSEKGYEEAKRVVRLHRLWEMYLTERMRLKADHIHPNAETMEHIITPEIEEQLLRELGYPETDPHQSPIPYPKH
ncbi:MAG TPA: zinc ABC transporter permease [Cryomorphaceae bacterium]|nr:zinc ABC transporter permease [Owenweeksia sp.]MBF98527.1 zinc ABC transporter permease [Owenweeksia sp.]HAD97515.1 zinc ABC transporter permease [Cryomorphaceae bacterium]|tara:strand:- start:4358 stop:5650 length:1293 start_codon:yes stop_codon:yes gene_type:complete